VSDDDVITAFYVAIIDFGSDLCGFKFLYKSKATGSCEAVAWVRQIANS
jgi:hypothetical protein